MGTQTINTTTQQDARISKAFGSYLALGRNATAAEVKAATIEFIKGVVYAEETAEAARIAAAAVDKVTPT